MLFSNPAVASFINDNFEPAWESVRPVPIVYVDFGGDASVTRTLHGNIATYVCNAEGNVLDILPGAYDSNTYLAQLKHLRSLYSQIVSAEQPLEQLQEYHAGKLATGSEEARLTITLTSQPELSTPPVPRIADFSKVLVIEKPVEAVLTPAGSAHAIGAASETADSENSMLSNLAQDTVYNEGHRRRQIHEQFAQADWTVPQSLTKWLYREVLNTDLDDPYLGLKDLLFSNYPFTDDAPDR